MKLVIELIKTVNNSSQKAKERAKLTNDSFQFERFKPLGQN